LLYTAVAERTGLLGAELDVDRGALTLDYDPGILQAQEVDELAADLGARLDSRVHTCQTRLSGGTCETCSDTQELHLSAPAVTGGTFTLAPGRVGVAMGAPAGLRAQVTHILRPDAVEAERLRPWQRLEPMQWEAILTVITALGIAIGWLGGALGLPHAWQHAAYLVAYLAGGYFGVREGLAELRRGIINVDLLMVLAAIGAAILGNWREGAILLFLFSLSNTLQDYAMGRSRRAIEALMKLRPEVALVRRGNGEVLVRVEALRLGDIVIVKPGERLPVDGVVRVGQSAVDQSTITGESVPVDVGPEKQVFASTVNLTGALEVEVTRLASESTLARIIKLVEEAHEQKAPTQRFLDEFEQKYALGVIAATLLALVIPVLVLGQPFEQSFYRAMTLLVVASPCALVISVPAAILSAIANAARRGILFKGGAHLENLASVKAVAFDKTGTLTGGKAVLTDLVPLAGQDEDALLALAAAVEARSEHPLAQAIVNAARQRQLAFEPAEDFEALSGRGAQATVAGRVFVIGKPELFLAQMDPAVGVELRSRVEALESQGKTTMLLGERGDENLRLHGIVAVADQPRAEARQAVQALRQAGIEHVIMLTGDNPRVAEAIAQQIGVDEYKAGLLPEDKVRYVQQLGERYGVVAMVGDGVNDAPALAAAGVGIAMGAAGTDVALETADVVLMSNDLTRLAHVVKLSHKARRIVWQNIAFALGVIVVLVASNFLVGVPLPLGVVAHEGSTLVVVANGLRLLGTR